MFNKYRLTMVFAGVIIFCLLLAHAALICAPPTADTATPLPIAGKDDYGQLLGAVTNQDEKVATWVVNLPATDEQHYLYLLVRVPPGKLRLTNVGLRPVGGDIVELHQYRDCEWSPVKQELYTGNSDVKKPLQLLVTGAFTAGLPELDRKRALDGFTVTYMICAR